MGETSLNRFDMVTKDLCETRRRVETNAFVSHRSTSRRRTGSSSNTRPLLHVIFIRHRQGSEIQTASTDCTQSNRNYLNNLSSKWMRFLFLVIQRWTKHKQVPIFIHLMHSVFMRTCNRLSNEQTRTGMYVARGEGLRELQPLRKFWLKNTFISFIY